MSSKPEFNEAAVRALPVPDKGSKVHFFRGAVVGGKELPRGLGVRCVAGGTKSFVLHYRLRGGKQRNVTIGQWPTWNCVKAAKRGHDLREALGRGETIGKAKADAERTEAGPTVADVLDAFLEAHRGLRTIDEYRRAFDRNVKPAIGQRHAYTLRRTDMAQLRDAIDAPVMASRVMSYLRSAFSWFQARDDEFENPIVKGQVKDASTPRERVLSDDEVWKLFDVLAQPGDWPAPWPGYLKILLLTAARRQEAASMRIEDIETVPDGSRLWVLPGERYKTKVQHSVPLSPQAWSIIKAEAGTRRTGHVFSTDGGKTALGGFGKPLRSLKLRMDAEFTIHDLRRTARTLMSRLKVPPHVAELCMGHAIPGIRGVYDRWAYYDEKRDAFAKLATEIDRLAGW